MKRTKLAVLIMILALIAAGCTPRNPQGSPQEEETNMPQEENSSGNDDPDPTNPEESQDPNENEEDSEEDKTDQETEPAQGNGDIKMGDYGYQVTVASPFKAQWNKDMGSLFITVPDDPSFQGAFFHDTSAKGIEQLESTVKNMEAQYKSNPTITDFKQEVDKGENGLFSFTFTYSAGEAEGSPAGFYYVHYQKTPTGLITGNFTCPKVTYSDAIKKMFDSITTETEKAMEAPAM